MTNIRIILNNLTFIILYSFTFITRCALFGLIMAFERMLYRLRDDLDSMVAFSVLGCSVIGFFIIFANPIINKAGAGSSGRRIVVLVLDTIIIYYLLHFQWHEQLTNTISLKEAVVGSLFAIMGCIMVVMSMFYLMFNLYRFLAELFQHDYFSLGKTSKKISSIIFAYIYLVVIYASIFWIIHIQKPDAFCRHLENFVDAIYFSTITIATVGYGDISPQSIYAKLAVITEVFSGILLLVFALTIITASPNSGSDNSK